MVNSRWFIVRNLTRHFKYNLEFDKIVVNENIKIYLKDREKGDLGIEEI